MGDGKMDGSFVLGHRPALDGLRGLSILLVLVGHLDLPWVYTRGGIVGVHFFFALSGFLITSLLLGEWRETGSIHFRRFYARRALRLLPALLLFIALLTALTYLLDGPKLGGDSARSALIAFLYSTNWAILAGKFPDPYLAHTWTLSIEEQFYIVWPGVLWVALRAFGKPSRVAVVTAAIMLCCWVHRYLLIPRFTRVYYGTDTNADMILSGALLALLVDGGLGPKTEFGRHVLHGLGALTVLACPVLLLTMRTNGTFGFYFYRVGMPVLELGLGFLILSLLFTPLRTLFERPWLVWLGKVSYSLYLWHAPVYHVAKRVWGTGPGAQAAGVVFTFLLASLSFYLLERPVLRLKRRLEVPKVRVQPAS